MAALTRGDNGIGAGEHPRTICIDGVERPAAARLSTTRLLIARGFTREAKSASEVKALFPRASTIISTA